MCQNTKILYAFSQDPVSCFHFTLSAYLLLALFSILIPQLLETHGFMQKTAPQICRTVTHCYIF